MSKRMLLLIDVQRNMLLPRSGSHMRQPSAPRSPRIWNGRGALAQW